MLFMGVVLKTSTRQRSSIAVIDESSAVVSISYFIRNEELLEIAGSLQPQTIAIGSPLTLPTGLCCLEAHCSCRMEAPDSKGRQAELELARIGISCFFTTKKSIVSKLVYRAVNLRQELAARGHSLVEVYPHASKLLLFGDNMPSRRNTKESLTFMKERLPGLVTGLDEHLPHLDLGACDALINAHTALLHSRSETDLIGCEVEGQIALPRLVRV